ncbi:MAG: hypothetical protein ACT4O0_01720 [Pseudonocardia sp.]|jgi:hypothetical protein
MYALPEVPDECTALLGRLPVLVPTDRYQLRRTGQSWRFIRRKFAPDSSLSGLPQWR